MRYQFRPLGPWTGPATPPGKRKRAAFRAGYKATLDLLRAEIIVLGQQDLVVLQLDLTERDIRNDGLPRADARYGSNPGVVVSFDSQFGPLRYATDVYTAWQDNLRAIALALEALRAVDRYGVSKRGEQYTGWRALPAGNGSAFASADAAERWMCERSRDLGLPVATNIPQLYRQLARKMHPDTGAEPSEWERLDAARNLLVTAGRI